jgi:hypothetical protein
MIHQIGHGRICKPLERFEIHADGIAVCARIEFDEFVLFQLHVTGGIAPTSQSGNAPLNSLSLERPMFSDRVMY